MKTELVKLPESCHEHQKMIINPTKMNELLEDLKLHMVPYYAHYYNLLHALEEEYINNHHGKVNEGLRSATFNALKQKVRAELDSKQNQIEKEVIEEQHKLT